MLTTHQLEILHFVLKSTRCFLICKDREKQLQAEAQCVHYGGLSPALRRVVEVVNRLVPWLEAALEGVEGVEYPALTSSDGEVVRFCLRYTLDRWHRATQVDPLPDFLGNGREVAEGLLGSQPNSTLVPPGGLVP